MSKEGQIDFFGNTENLSMNDIDGFVQIRFFDHHAHVLTRNRIVEQQWNNLVFGQGIKGFVKAAQVHSHDGNDRNILYYGNLIDILG